MVRTFGRSDSISFCRDAGFRVQLRFCVGSAGKPAAGPSGFFAREGNIVFRGGGLTAASALAVSGLAVAAADLQSRFAGCVGVVSPP